MIIYSTSLFAAPVMLLVWAADIYVFLASVRLILGRIAGLALLAYRHCARSLGSQR